jgi:hypothetical protein
LLAFNVNLDLVTSVYSDSGSGTPLPVGKVGKEVVGAGVYGRHEDRTQSKTSGARKVRMQQVNPCVYEGSRAGHEVRSHDRYRHIGHDGISSK